jgi:hypothetical protein
MPAPQVHLELIDATDLAEMLTLIRQWPTGAGQAATNPDTPRGWSVTTDGNCPSSRLALVASSARLPSHGPAAGHRREPGCHGRS